MESLGREYFYKNYVLINGEHPVYRDKDEFWFKVIEFFEKNPNTIILKEKR